MGNIGGLISTWSYIAKDGPNFPIGNGINLASATMIFSIGIIFWFWMKHDNQKREGRNVDAELAGMSQVEIWGLDWRHPGFRWRT